MQLQVNNRQKKPVMIHEDPEYILNNPYQCSCCGTRYSNQKGNFPQIHSYIYAKNNYCGTICYRCLQSLFTKYSDEFGDDTQAIKRICMITDAYFNVAVCKSIESQDNPMKVYFRKITTQFPNKIFDDYLYETSGDDLQEQQDNALSDSVITRWGVGLFSPDQYRVLEEHYKMLKKQNPHCDSNQEIFIKDLCYTKLQQLEAMKNGSPDNFKKLTELYRETFKQAGLKAVDDESDDDVLGVTIATIAEYTPEEYYQDKTLYKDFDGLGAYLTQTVFRPLKNLITGGSERDPKYSVEDDDE